MHYIASWSQCHLPLPNVRADSPSQEERKAWLYALLSATTHAFSLFFPHPPKTLAEAKEMAKAHEKGPAVEPLARLYHYASRAEWPTLPLKGRPFSGRGMGVVDTTAPFVRKTSCSAPPQYVAAFAASVASFAVRELRALEGIEPDLSPTEALQRGQPLRSRRPLWMDLQALAKAYPEVKPRKAGGRRPKGAQR